LLTPHDQIYTSDSQHPESFLKSVMTINAHHPRKAHERFLLERFANAADIQLQIVEEREAPDFLASVNGRLIGVEVTELFVERLNGQRTMQAHESIANRIVGKAQRLYMQSGAPPAHVTVCFGPSKDLRRLNRDRLSEALAGFVIKLALEPWQRVDWRPDFVSKSLPDEVSFLHALGTPSQEMAHWSVARAGWVAPLKAEPLQARVDEKARRLPTYELSISENWLVVVANAMNPSQLLEAKPDFQPDKIASPFARTYFYRHPDAFVIQLGETR
jgi:hypothetical protein